MECVRLDFDASIQSDELYVGFIIRNPETNNILDTYSRNTLAAQDSTQGEIIALLHGLRYVIKKYNPNSIKIYGDSHSVIQMMNERSDITPTKPDIKQLITATYNLLYEYMDSFTVYYIPSHENDAHYLVNNN